MNASAGNCSVFSTLGRAGCSSICRFAPSPLAFSRNRRVGSWGGVCTRKGRSVGLPTRGTSWSRVSISNSTASWATVAPISRVTTTSQVWRVCSPNRSRSRSLNSWSAPNMDSLQLRRSCSSSASSCSRNAPSATSASATLSLGTLAFQCSHTGANSSAPGAGSPRIPAWRNSVKISAPDPRWARTWAIDHSLAYDGSATCSAVNGATTPASRRCELFAAASQASNGSVPVVMTEPRQACRAGLRGGHQRFEASGPVPRPSLGWAAASALRGAGDDPTRPVSYRITVLLGTGQHGFVNAVALGELGHGGLLRVSDELGLRSYLESPERVLRVDDEQVALGIATQIPVLLAVRGDRTFELAVAVHEVPDGCRLWEPLGIDRG